MKVRISSEAAGEITMTKVITRDMSLHELLEVMLAVCGRDPSRIRELLERGTIVESASRFRWDPLQIDDAALAGHLAGFPQPDPTRRFDAARCVRAWLCGPRTRIELTRDIAASKRVFKRRSFWDVLLESALPEYVDYSYRERADLFRSPADGAKLREAAALLKYSGLSQQVARASIETVELAVLRQAEAANR